MKFACRITWRMASSKENSLSECVAIKFTRLLLTSLGVWQTIKENPTICEFIISLILKFICYSSILFCVVPSSYHIFVRENDLSPRIALSGPIGLFTMNMLKYTMIIYHRKDIKECLEHIEDDWNDNYNDKEYMIMMKNVLIGRRITILCAVFLSSGGMSYHTIMPFIMGSPALDDDDHRPIVFPGYDVLFDPFVTPVYEIVYFIHCLAALYVYIITTASCNIAANFVTHICSQIQIIIAQLNGLVDDGYHQNNHKLQMKIGKIVKRHARVLRFTVVIEKVLRKICLIEVSISTVLICLVEYYCMTTFNDSEIIGIVIYFAILSALSFNIFILCYIGELLNQQCFAAGTTAYMIDWYRLPPNAVTSLILVIASAQIPRKLTAGGLLDLSWNSFINIMKTSVVYLNLLRTVEA